MAILIRKAAVIGSGVMGAGIAAHLANAGIPCLLLDVKRDTAEKAVARLAKTNPAPLFRPACASLIEPGELEAELHRLAEVDWVIEAVTERLDVKRELLARRYERRPPVKFQIAPWRYGLKVPPEWLDVWVRR